MNENIDYYIKSQYNKSISYSINRGSIYDCKNKLLAGLKKINSIYYVYKITIYSKTK